MARDNRTQSRRSFMQKTAGAGSLAALGGFAGCAGATGGGSSNSASSGGSSGGGSSATSTGASSGDGARTSMGSIANLKNSYWLSWKKGYVEACEALGYETNLQTNDGQVDKQIQQFNTAIADNVDTIVGQTYTNAAAISLAETCVEAGVPTVLAVTIAKWFTPQDAGEEYVQFFTPHFVRHAYTGAKALFEEMGGEGGVVHIEGNPGTAPNIGRNLGFKKALKEYPDIELLGPELPGNWIRTDARRAMSDLISKHGKNIDGYFGQNDAVAIGGLTILQENDIDVPVVGIDASEPGLKKVQNGEMLGTVSGMGPWQAGWSIAKVHDWLEGYKLSAPERMMSFDASLCVADEGKWRDTLDTPLPVLNAEQYEKDIFSGSTPYDWKKMSVAEAGEDAWDPQIKMDVIRKEDLTGLMDWNEKNKPKGYSLPDVFDQPSKMDEVDKLYEERFQNNPLKG